MSDECGIALGGLFFVDGLGVSGAFFGVVGGEGGEELEDSETLVDGGEGDGVTGACATC